jgi:mannitol-1-phosphate/altronate dehydrogenase
MSAALAALAPAYRAAHGGARAPAILHLGVGNFARSHLLFYTDRFLRAQHAEEEEEEGGEKGGENNLNPTPNPNNPQNPDNARPSWTVHGVGLVDSRDELELHDTLAAQDHVYGLLSLPSGEATPVGALAGLTHMRRSAEDMRRVLAAVADPRTRIISSTVTEKGYYHDPITGDLDLSGADSPVRRDLERLRGAANPGGSVQDLYPLESAVGTLVAGLALRMHPDIGGGAPVTLLCCDNLPSNGKVLQKLVLQMCAEVDPSGELGKWVARNENVSFPCSMVDRITPAAAEDTGARFVAAAVGGGGGDLAPCQAPVQGEDFHQWIVEDNFAAGRPSWELLAGGEPCPAVRFVDLDTVERFEDMKLRLLNGSHTSLAYVSSLAFQDDAAGPPTVDKACADKDVDAFIRGYMREVAPTLKGGPEGADALEAYQATLLERFSNAEISDAVSRLAQDGSKKMLGFVLPPLEDKLFGQGGDAEGTKAMAGVVASWCAYLATWPEAEIDDPAGMDAGLVELARRASAEGGDAAGVAGFVGATLGARVAGHHGFVGQVAEALAVCRFRGVREMMRRAVGGGFVRDGEELRP